MKQQSNSARYNEDQILSNKLILKNKDGSVEATGIPSIYITMCMTLDEDIQNYFEENININTLNPNHHKLKIEFDGYENSLEGIPAILFSKSIYKSYLEEKNISADNEHAALRSALENIFVEFFISLIGKRTTKN